MLQLFLLAALSGAVTNVQPAVTLDVTQPSYMQDYVHWYENDPENIVQRTAENQGFDSYKTERNLIQLNRMYQAFKGQLAK